MYTSSSEVSDTIVVQNLLQMAKKYIFPLLLQSELGRIRPDNAAAVEPDGGGEGRGHLRRRSAPRRLGRERNGGLVFPLVHWSCDFLCYTLHAVEE